MSYLYLLDNLLEDFFGPMLPSNCEMLRYYHYLHQAHTSRYSVRKSVSRCYELWEKAGISTAPRLYAIAQMKNLVSEYEDSKKMWLSYGKKDFEFHERLNELFFIGTEDALKTCDDNARNLLVASLTVHLSYNVLDKIKRVKEEMDCKKIVNFVEDDFKLVKNECEISFEAFDDKTKLNVLDNIKRVKEDIDCKKIDNFVEDDFKLVKKDCEISFEASDDKKEVLPKIKRFKKEINCKEIFNVVGNDKLVKDECEISFEASDDKTKLKILDEIKRVKEEMNCKKIANVVDNDFKLVKDECEISFEASDDKTKLKILDEIKRVKEEVNCKKIANVVENDFKLVKDECEISFEASDNKTKLKVELNNNNEYYSAYLFEEEWNVLYPNYVEQETKYFPSFHRSTLGVLYCVYCYQTMTSDLEVRVGNDISEFTCHQCFSVNFARS